MIVSVWPRSRSAEILLSVIGVVYIKVLCLSRYFGRSSISVGRQVFGVITLRPADGSAGECHVEVETCPKAPLSIKDDKGTVKSVWRAERYTGAIKP
jgi:hypothetical protein